MTLEGRTVLVTGSTDGIGKETALQLARMGAKVLLHGRDPKKGQAVLEEIRIRQAAIVWNSIWLTFPVSDR